MPETPTEVEAFTQARWSGALKALTQYLPHLIGAVALAVAGVLFTINHEIEKADKADTGQHIADKENQIHDLLLTTSNLTARVAALEQINHFSK